MNGIIPEHQKKRDEALSGYRDSALSLSFLVNIIATPGRITHAENQSVKTGENGWVGHRTIRISQNPKNSFQPLRC
jgi:hypothetical protein